jgi:uncharacterized protein YggU (UPF0235/DUF167 family)
LENFHSSHHNIIVDGGEKNEKKKFKIEKININFVNVETHPRLWYSGIVILVSIYLVGIA